MTDRSRPSASARANQPVMGCENLDLAIGRLPHCKQKPRQPVRHVVKSSGVGCGQRVDDALHCLMDGEGRPLVGARLVGIGQEGRDA